MGSQKSLTQFCRWLLCVWGCTVCCTW